MTASSQVTALVLYSAVIGAFIGVIYDIFRILRIALPEVIKGTKAETVIVFFQDIIFWLITSAVFIIFIYYANKGMTRLIMIFASGAGFLIYYYTVGRIVIFFSGAIIGLVKHIVKLFYKILINPLIFLITGVIIVSGKFFKGRINRRTERKAVRLAERGYGLR